MDWPINVKLATPIEHDGKVYNSLDFREPTVRVSIAVAETATAMQPVVLLAGMAGLPADVFLDMTESQYVPIRDRVLEPYQSHMLAKQGADGTPGNAEAA